MITISKKTIINCYNLILTFAKSHNHKCKLPSKRVICVFKPVYNQKSSQRVQTSKIQYNKKYNTEYSFDVFCRDQNQDLGISNITLAPLSGTKKNC